MVNPHVVRVRVVGFPELPWRDGCARCGDGQQRDSGEDERVVVSARQEPSEQHRSRWPRCRFGVALAQPADARHRAGRHGDDGKQNCGRPVQPAQDSQHQRIEAENAHPHRHGSDEQQNGGADIPVCHCRSTLACDGGADILVCHCRGTLACDGGADILVCHPQQNPPPQHARADHPHRRHAAVERHPDEHIGSPFARIESYCAEEQGRAGRADRGIRVPPRRSRRQRIKASRRVCLGLGFIRIPVRRLIPLDAEEPLDRIQVRCRRRVQRIGAARRCTGPCRSLFTMRRASSTSRLRSSSLRPPSLLSVRETSSWATW